MRKLLLKLLNAVDRRENEFLDELIELRENHIAHIYTRLGVLEGKLSIVLTVLAIVASAVIGQLVLDLIPT